MIYKVLNDIFVLLEWISQSNITSKVNRELHDIKDQSYTPFAFKIKIHINESN